MKNLLEITKNNRGDTIVEVLLSIAIVSLVLGGAYASTNHSAQATRTAQERGEALKLAESQIEQIRVAANANTPDIFSANNFCLAAGSFNASPVCVSATGVPYQTTIIHTAGADDFQAKVTWENLGGGTNNVELDYRAQ